MSPSSLLRLIYLIITKEPIIADFKEALGRPTKSYFIWAAQRIHKNEHMLI